MTITYADFLKTVEENDGEVLPTSGGRAWFRLAAGSDGVRFTPQSSGKVRSLDPDSIQRYLDVFNRTGSLTTSDYTDKMRNASYVLAVIGLWQAQQGETRRTDEETGDGEDLDPEFSVPEGGLKVVLAHRRRERCRQLVSMAKEIFRVQNGKRLFCEVCGFDFGRTYGDPDFIEVHHRIPLCRLAHDARTRLSDLALVCANCHRMLHRGDPWPTVEELKRKLAAVKAG